MLLSVMQGQIFKGLVLGFGVNISAGANDVKLVTDKYVTSVSLERGKLVDGKLFLNDLLNLFFQDYNKFLESGFEFIKHDYVKRVNFLEKELCVKVFNDTKCGVAKGINDNGALILEKNNEKFVLTIGDIL